ncbi:MAG: hypothetical protein ACFFAJ_10030 [Candidatus Hodarchaeota archaeon]
MSDIKYPTSLFCPACKEAIKLDYEGGLKKRRVKGAGHGDLVATEDLLGMTILHPYSRNSAKDAKQNKQDIKYFHVHILICHHCHTILGAWH